MVEKIFKFLLNTLTVIAVIVIIIVVLGNVQMKLSGNKFPSYFGYTFFKVTTGSMGDTVKVDDIVVVKITKDVELNDIITFIEGDSFITHRLIKVEKNKLITKGDANNAKDVAITLDDVVGKVTIVLSGLGIWKQVLTTPRVILAICLTILLFDIAFSYKGEFRWKNEKKVS